MTKEAFEGIQAGDLLSYRNSSRDPLQFGLVLDRHVDWPHVQGAAGGIEVLWTGRDGERGPPWWYDYSHFREGDYEILLPSAGISC